MACLAMSLLLAAAPNQHLIARRAHELRQFAAAGAAFAERAAANCTEYVHNDTKVAARAWLERCEAARAQSASPERFGALMANRTNALAEHRHICVLGTDGRVECKNGRPFMHGMTPRVLQRLASSRPRSSAVHFAACGACNQVGVCNKPVSSDVFVLQMQCNQNVQDLRRRPSEFISIIKAGSWPCFATEGAAAAELALRRPNSSRSSTWTRQPTHLSRRTVRPRDFTQVVPWAARRRSVTLVAMLAWPNNQRGARWDHIRMHRVAEVLRLAAWRDAAGMPKDSLHIRLAHIGGVPACQMAFLRVADLLASFRPTGIHPREEFYASLKRWVGEANNLSARVFFDTSEAAKALQVRNDPVLAAWLGAREWKGAVREVAAEFCREFSEGGDGSSAQATLQLENVGDGLYSAPSLNCGIGNGAVVLRDPSVSLVLVGLWGYSKATVWQLRSHIDLAAIVRASASDEFARLGAANRAFAAACGPTLAELWTTANFLEFADAYAACVE